MAASKWDWTTEAPSAPGWYWVWDDLEVECVYFEIGDSGKLVYRCGVKYEDDYICPAEDTGTHFIGPLIPPPPPIGTVTPVLVRAGAKTDDGYGQL